MSEQVSAFAAYKSGTNKKSTGNNKKSNQKSPGGAGSGSKKKNATKNKSAAKKAQTQKDNLKPTTKNQPKNVKSKTENKTIVQNGGASTSAATAKATARNKNTSTTAVTKAVHIKKSNSTGSNAAAPKKPVTMQQSERDTNNRKSDSFSNGINANEIDRLVEELMGDSPSKPKKLTKAQQKKKKELEEYLVRELEKDDQENDISGEENYSSSEEFTDEYTINSYTSEDEEEWSGEEEETTFNESYSTNGEEGSQSTSQQTSKTKASTSKKRHSNQAAIDDSNSNTTAAKKPRQSTSASVADIRKSLPAKSTGSTSKTAQSKENKRHSVSEIPNQTVKTVDAQAIKFESLSPPSNVTKMNSIKEGEKTFNWLLNPISIKEFYEKYWESGACLVRRRKKSYFSHLISFEGIDQMLLKNHVEFTKNIDITSYKNGVRETLNPEGRAMPPVVWDHYGQGCSIRLLNPHTFMPQLYTLNATLQEYFHCLVGANVYLTPPNSQGFAPHYDDIEAFVLQIEGRKRWRLYAPRNVGESLPRFSSKNFEQNEIGKPIFDEVLEPGDMLYFPRGTIHQATTEPGYHSLHITLSVYQKQSYADLFEKMVPLLLQRAIENNVHLRRGLPLHTWQNAGIAYSDNDTKERADLLQQVSKLMSNCLKSSSIAEVMDAAVDQLAKKYQHEALPPEIMPSERLRTIFGSRSTTNENGDCVCDYEISERSNVRLLRAHILRLVQEEEKLRIYYHLDNSKTYCEYEPNFIEIDAEEAASVEVLMRSYPEYIGVSQLPLASDENKIELVSALWERGLLMLEKPFK